MAATYGTFGSFILFKLLTESDLGHLYRAGKLSKAGLEKTTWLHVFDGPAVPSADLAAAVDDVNRIGEILTAVNVASGVEAVVEDGTVGLSWNHAPGQPLANVFTKVQEEGFPIAVDNALLIMEKLSLALSAALAVDVRGSSLVHGFLHPSLITVTNDGEVIVAGFGLGDVLLGVLDDAGARERCAPYVAPEVLDSRTATKRGDVYSLGAILFHLLTGKLLPAAPADRKAAVASAQLAFEEDPVPQDVMAVLSRALADRPEDRFSSAADFKKELDKLLYGGAYSPTTFNLALFMDRLFRAEIETEEKERLEESQVDVEAYLRPQPEPEPVVLPDSGEFATPPARGGGSKLSLILGGAAAIVVAALAGFFFLRGPSGPPAMPTPTPEEVAARKEAQQKQVEALVQEQVALLMKEREEQIRQELLNRQSEIEKLQKQLQRVKKTETSDAEAARKKREIEQQIAAAEEAKRKQEQALAEERRRAEEKARQALATPAPEPTDTPVPAAAAPPTPTPVPPTPTPSGVQENQFVPATDVDTRPEILKRVPVTWPRVALHSRRRGVVILSATVDARGRVVDVEVLRSDEDGFGIPQAAMDAVQKYVFKPATKDGVKVKSTATVTIPYSFRQLR